MENTEVIRGGEAGGQASCLSRSRNDEFRTRTAKKAEGVVLPTSALLDLNKSPAGGGLALCGV